MPISEVALKNKAAMYDVNSRYLQQEATEAYYNKKTVREHINAVMDADEELLECMFQASLLITMWAGEQFSYDSKNVRLALLVRHNSISQLVYDIMTVVYELDEQPEQLTSMVGMCSGMIKGMSAKDAVITTGEILTLMCDADLFDMEQRESVIEDDETGEEFTTMSWFIFNPWELGSELQTHIRRAMYLPPMIVPPRLLKHNKSTGYLTKEDESLILGHGNHHRNCISLDALNKFNQVPLSLNLEMVKEVTEELLVKNPEALAKIHADEERKEQHEKLIRDSYHVFAYLQKNGNRFYLEHKVDKRGRVYAQGYHCSTQGNSFRKAIVELADKEKVSGSF